jgi:putative hydrolase
MTGSVALDEDYHVHSVFSDGVSTVDENVVVARDRGLRTLCLVDHVRADTGWVPDFVRAVWPLRALAGIGVLAGVETKILDRAGRLDLPENIDGIDLVLIADHQFPGDAGPVDPGDMREALQSGQARAPDVISCLVEATVNALQRFAPASPDMPPAAPAVPPAAPAVRPAAPPVPPALAPVPSAGPRPLIAHLFSVLPKLGLDESQIPDELLGLLADQASQAGALVEVNEKWACPAARSLLAFHQAGVPLVASTDSHESLAIGSYTVVRRILAEAAVLAENAVLAEDAVSGTSP